MNRTNSIFVALVWVALTAAAAPACSVPVFRYALNYWPADLYDLHAPSPKLPDDITCNINPTRSDSQSAELMLGDRKIWS
ncbi:MAG TPA: hypothetical protein VLJ39_22915, partial [Tepidisphaeraceae bacterium]|nr:hypothetical protein [Tepidisphaeraceae bacterium]